MVLILALIRLVVEVEVVFVHRSGLVEVRI
jgi:hypothetical protein